MNFKTLLSFASRLPHASEFWEERYDSSLRVKRSNPMITWMPDFRLRKATALQDAGLTRKMDCRARFRFQFQRGSQ
jgi:hypothetical protein